MAGKHQEHEGPDPVMVGLGGLGLAVVLGVGLAIVVFVVGLILLAKFWVGG